MQTIDLFDTGYQVVAPETDCIDMVSIASTIAYGGSRYLYGFEQSHDGRPVLDGFSGQMPRVKPWRCWARRFRQSTLLNLMAGLDAAEAGSIQVDDQDISVGMIISAHYFVVNVAG